MDLSLSGDRIGHILEEAHCGVPSFGQTSFEPLGVMEH